MASTTRYRGGVLGVWKRGVGRARRSATRSSLRSSKRATRPPGRGGNTMRSIPTTASSPPSWSSAGTSACLPSALEDERDALAARSQTPLTRTEGERLLALGTNIEGTKHSPGATSATRMRIVRTLVEEIAPAWSFSVHKIRIDPLARFATLWVSFLRRNTETLIGPIEQRSSCAMPYAFSFHLQISRIALLLVIMTCIL